MLMFAYGASSVKCAMCNFVTPAAGQPGAVPPAGAGASASQGSAASSSSDAAVPTVRTTVVVENPPSVDDDGNHLTNTALGVALIPEKPAAGK